MDSVLNILCSNGGRGVFKKPFPTKCEIKQGEKKWFLEVYAKLTLMQKEKVCAIKYPLYNIICLRVTPQEGFLLILTLVNWTA